MRLRGYIDVIISTASRHPVWSVVVGFLGLFASAFAASFFDQLIFSPVTQPLAQWVSKTAGGAVAMIFAMAQMAISIVLGILVIAAAMISVAWATWSISRSHLPKHVVEVERAASPAKPRALSSAQEKLLALINHHQRHFAASKLVIERSTGKLHFDGLPEKGADTSLVRDMYGASSKIDADRFEVLLESIPPEYVRLLPEARWDNPFVAAITEAGIAYLRDSASTSIPMGAVVEILYDPTDDRYVRRRQIDGKTVARYWVGLRNNLTDRTIYNVVVAIHGERPFVDEVFSSPGYRRPIFEEWDRIDPGVTEWVELFGLNETTGAVDGQVYPESPQRFEFEVRAKDTQRSAKTFELDQTKKPPLRLV